MKLQEDEPEVIDITTLQTRPDQAPPSGSAFKAQIGEPPASSNTAT